MASPSPGPMTAIGLQWFSFRFHRCHSRFPKVSHLPSPPMARLPQVRGLTKQRFGTASRVSRPDTRWARRRGTLSAASITVGSCAFGSGASLARWPFECLVRLCRGLRGPGREKSRRSQTARRGEARCWRRVVPGRVLARNRGFIPLKCFSRFRV